MKSLLLLALAAGLTGNLAAETVWLDTLKLSAATQGYGEPQKNKSVEGKPLTIGGKTFERGFGTHADSLLRIKLDGGAQHFSASVGVDDDVNGNAAASVEFVVAGDGKTLWKSGVQRAGEPAKTFTVDLAGVQTLTLEVNDAGDGIDYDHADWADASFDMAAGQPVALGGESALEPVAPYILTPAAPATPRINGASVFGVRPGSPFLFMIPATGDRPMKFSAKGLPRGLKVNAKTGLITGAVKAKGEYAVTLRAKNSLGTAEKKFHPINAARAKSTYGWPSVGTLAMAPKTNAKMPAAASGCSTTHATPRNVCR